MREQTRARRASSRLSLITGLTLAAAACTDPAGTAGYTIYPADGARDVSPDTRIRITFESPPEIGDSGLIRIADAATGEEVDVLDMSLPAGPPILLSVSAAERAAREEAGEPEPTYQETTIGGVDGFHFHPIIVRGNVATIYPHNNRLEYDRDYTVTIDPGVLDLRDADQSSSSEPISFSFSTRDIAPELDGELIVATDGSGDFDTVQGAIDFVPDRPAEPTTILIRNGEYEEIVFANGKSDLTIRGESRDGVIVGYANNSAFNPSRNGVSLRPAFSVHRGTNVQLSDFTIRNHLIGQAEALKMNGEHNIIDNMTLDGSGDALTTGGTIYMVDSTLIGDGDTILGYASLYCLRCKIQSVGPFTWTRTPEGQHGNVFVGSTFIYLDEPLPWTVKPDGSGGRKVDGVLARLPQNGPVGSAHRNFPHAEMVLIDAKLDGVPPIGWGPIEDPETFDWSNVRFMEFNSTDLNGAPLDMSARHPIVRVLTSPADDDLVAQYRDPAFVLGGWRPQVR